MLQRKTLQRKEKGTATDSRKTEWVPKTGALPSGACCVSAPAGVECGSRPRERSRRYREGSDRRWSGLTWNWASIGINLKRRNCQANFSARAANWHKSRGSRQLSRCVARIPSRAQFASMPPFVNILATCAPGIRRNSHGRLPYAALLPNCLGVSRFATSRDQPSASGRNLGTRNVCNRPRFAVK